MTIITHQEIIDVTTHDSPRPQRLASPDRLELQFDNPQELAVFVAQARLTLQRSWLREEKPSLWIPI